MPEDKSIALVGRPNVGKSRLFNRLLGRRVSIVHDKPGVTRDIVIEKLADGLLLMDTGGMGASGDSVEKTIADATNKQAEFAVMAADLIVFVVDAQSGITPLDEEIAAKLRKCGKRIVLAVNKVDTPAHMSGADDFRKLGFKDFVEVSAEHGLGIDALSGIFSDEFGALENSGDVDGGSRIKICVAGRPNVGKSSIANRLLGDDKLIVSPLAGTTRDSVWFDIDAKMKNGETLGFRLFDTAGLRARRKTNTSLDFLSSLRSRRAIEASDVVFLVIDAMEGVSELDKRLAGEILEAGASIIVVVNKWDYAVETFSSGKLPGYSGLSDFGKKFEAAVRASLPFIGASAVLFTSARDNRGIDRLLPSARKLFEKMNSCVSTGRLNSTVRKIIEKSPPKSLSGRRFKVYYCVKTSSKPYTVRMFCNNASLLSETYRRYLVNAIRNELRLGGVSVKLEAKGKPPRRNNADS